MKICPINNNYNNFSFKAKIREIHQGEVSRQLAREIDAFDEDSNYGKAIGETPYTYWHLLPKTGHMIKSSHPYRYAERHNKKFIPLAENVQEFSALIGAGEKFVAAVDTENNNSYLVTTNLRGDNIEGAKNSLNSPRELNELFKTLLKLDKAGIINRDMSLNNFVILEDKSIGVRGFDDFVQFKNYNENASQAELITPSFMMPSNAQMFEQFCLPEYILDLLGVTFRDTGSISEDERLNMQRTFARNFFKEYLSAKSIFARRRAAYLQENNNEGKNCEKIEYELLQEKYLKNPDDSMINLQAKRLEMFYIHSQIQNLKYSAIKDSHCIYDLLPLCFSGFFAAKNMAGYAEQMKQKTEDEFLQKYLDYEIKFTKLWYMYFNQITQEYLSEANFIVEKTDKNFFENLSKNTSRERDERYTKLLKNSNKLIPIYRPKSIEKYLCEPHAIEAQDISKNPLYSEITKKTDLLYTNTKSILQSRSELDKNVFKKHEKIKSDYLKSFEQLQEAVQSKDTFIILPLAYRTHRLFRSYLHDCEALYDNYEKMPKNEENSTVKREILKEYLSIAASYFNPSVPKTISEITQSTLDILAAGLKNENVFEKE